MRAVSGTAPGSSTALASLLLRCLRFYQTWISPLLAPACRFHPTCSHYACEAIEVHGGFRGLWLALKRLLRCQPFFRGGFDPVPRQRAANHASGSLP